MRATVRASTAVAGCVVGAAVAGAGAPAALPLAFALQKAVLCTNIGGAPANPILAGVGESMQWVQGRFGLFDSAEVESSDTNASIGRR